MRDGLKKFGAIAIAIAVMGIGSQAHAVISADIVFLIDNSASMGNDITEVKARIGDFNTAMINNGIDAMYSLTRVGGGAPGGHFLQDLTDFTTFTMAGNPFQNLTANAGNPESGSTAVNVALANTTFRVGAVKNFILITDEDDDSSVADFNTANAGLGNANALFNFIGVPGVGNTDARYGVLAANHGGVGFNILDFRNNPDPFFVNFIDTKVQEIIDAGNAVPEPVTAVLGLLSLGALAGATSRRRIA